MSVALQKTRIGTYRNSFFFQERCGAKEIPTNFQSSTHSPERMKCIKVAPPLANVVSSVRDLKNKTNHLIRASLHRTTRLATTIEEPRIKLRECRCFPQQKYFSAHSILQNVSIRAKHSNEHTGGLIYQQCVEKAPNSVSVMTFRIFARTLEIIITVDESYMFLLMMFIHTRGRLHPGTPQFNRLW